MITLQRIRFDRGSESAPAALPLRASSNHRPAGFDWTRTTGIVRQPVAYPRSASGRAALTAELSIATAPQSNLLIQARALSGGPLSVVRFRLAAGTTGTVTLSAPIADTLGSEPVGKTELRWVWEWSADDGATWPAFDETSHEIYVVLDEPCAPWGRPGSTERIAPWADVIDQACTWARGESDAAAVVRRITAEVNALGGQRILDECGKPQTIAWQSGTDYHISNGRSIFLCSDFIRLARLERTNHYQLNCLDCASAVGTFATVLGVAVQRTEMLPGRGAQHLECNPVWLIGRTAARDEEFAVHVAASSGTGRTLVISDACLKVDFDPGPPRDWDVAAAHPFEAGSGVPGYRKLLLRPREPRPVMFEAESLSYPDGTPPGAPPFHSPAFDYIRAGFRRRLEDWSPILPDKAIDDLELLDQLGVNRTLVETRDVLVDGVPYRRRYAPVAARDGAAATLRLDVLLARTVDHTRGALLDILVGYTTPLTRVRDIADVAFYCPADESIVAVRSSLVVWLRNDPQHAVPIRSQMRQIDLILAPVLT